MKNKKLWIWVISVVAVLAATVTVFANFDDLIKQKMFNKQILEKATETKKPTVEDVKKEIQIELIDGSKKVFIYQDTVTDVAGFRTDKYEADNISCIVNKQGKILLYTNNSENHILSNKLLSDEKLKELSENFLAKRYPQDFSGYEFNSIIERAGGYKSVVFFKNYGYDKYLLGPHTYVRIYQDGTIKDFGMPDIDRYAKFDPESVANIGKKELSEYANKMVQEHYENGTIKSHDMKEARIVNVDGEYVIEVTVHGLLNSSDHDSSHVFTFYYQI